MDFVWSWTDGLFQGICSCGNSDTTRAAAVKATGDQKQQQSMDGWPQQQQQGQWRNSSQSEGHCSSPPPPLPPFTVSQAATGTTAMNGTAAPAADFLGLLEKMQSQRMDDQRCEMPSSTLKNGNSTGGCIVRQDVAASRRLSREGIKQILSHNSPPYPQIVLPAQGGFWLDGINGDSLHDEYCHGLPPLHHRPAEMLMTTSAIESTGVNCQQQ